MPADLGHAEELLAAGPAEARAYAGGTDLLGVLKDGVHPDFPRTVVNLKGIPGLTSIEECGGAVGRDDAADGDGAGAGAEGDATSDNHGLRIGALATLRQLERHPLVRARYPLLAQAAASVAAPQLRNMGTVAGNICQEPRCWYYRHPEDTFHCTRKGGAACNAFTGENRFHSIFGSVTVDTRPCTAACPGGVRVPEYMALIRAGDLDQAAALLLESNPLPAITGRVCPHYCETDCNRERFDEAVSVRAVERYLGDYILAHAPRFLGPPPAGSGVRVAVVGSGPAGLAAAFYLRRAGHKVTVFERQPEPGGMLRYAIPGYRLPLEVLQQVIAALAGCGIEFRTGVDVGVDVTLDDLRRDYAAVFVGPGAWGQPRMGLENEELLEPGLDFLRRVRTGDRPPVGRRVVVIGGGNVAVDVAVAARRLGAESVTMAFLETCEDMPAFVQEVDQAREEGVQILESCGPARIRTNDAGRLTGLDLMRCVCVFDAGGRFAPAFDETDMSSIEADQVILAIGQRVELGGLAVEGLLDEGGRLAVDAETGAAALPGLFAGGDAVTGPASVIAALAAGRRAAVAIEEYLAGTGATRASTVSPADAGGRALQGFSPECLRPSPPRCRPSCPSPSGLSRGPTCPGASGWARWRPRWSAASTAAAWRSPRPTWPPPWWPWTPRWSRPGGRSRQLSSSPPASALRRSWHPTNW